MNSYSNSYKDAGVDVTAGYRSVELMRKHVESTAIPGVMSGIGGFGGLFRPDFSGMKEPVLVSGTDGVGTKLKIAFMMNKHDTIGIDCVAMCANDVACSGAQPLFFLDYLAVDKNHPERIAEIVSGVANGCIQAGCALIGGETAEMPGLYSHDEYDLAGFCVGMADREKLLDSANVKVGDVLVGVASSGIHSNGYSLVRHVFRVNDDKLRLYLDDLGRTLGEELLEPTRIYVKPVLKCLEACEVHGIANITGGGFYENIPRMLPDGMMARVEKASVRVHPIFNIIQMTGRIDEHDMFNTFNMGVGLVMAVPASDVDKVIATLTESGEKAYVIGEVVEGDKGVEIC